MKRALVTGYTFTAATKTLDFSSISGFNARYLVAVVNVTQKVVIYGVGITGKGYTSLTGGNVFVLQYDVTLHGNSDILYIVYDDIGGDATNGLDVDVTRMAALVAGSAVIGQVGIDQTTVGTTDSVTIKASVGIGSLTEGAPATDTASSGLNGRLQRIAQRLTSLIALLPTALGANGGLKIEGVASGTVVPVSDGAGSLTVDGTVAASNLPTTVDTNSGNKSASTLRVVLATDQPALTNALSVTDTRLPTALGSQVSSTALGVVPASDWTLPKSILTELTGSASSATTVIASTDVSGYRSFSVQLGFTGTATTTFEGSNDNVTFFSVLVYAVNNGQFVTTLTAGGLVAGNVTTKYIRVRVSAWTSGTITGTMELSPFGIAPMLPNGNNAGIPKLEAVNSQGASALGASSIADNNGGASVMSMAQYVKNSAGNVDAVKNVHALTILSSSARTTTTNSSDQTNYNWHGLLLTVDVSSAGTGSITPSIQVKDVISGNYKTIWTAAAAVITTGTFIYALAPNVAAASYLEAVQLLVGRTWRLVMTHNNANSITYSTSADMVL